MLPKGVTLKECPICKSKSMLIGWVTCASGACYREYQNRKYRKKHGLPLTGNVRKKNKMVKRKRDYVPQTGRKWKTYYARNEIYINDKRVLGFAPKLGDNGLALTE